MKIQVFLDHVPSTSAVLRELSDTSWVMQYCCWCLLEKKNPWTSEPEEVNPELIRVTQHKSQIILLSPKTGTALGVIKSQQKIKWSISLVLQVSLSLFSCWGMQGVSSLLILERVEILRKQILASLFSCCKCLFTCDQSHSFRDRHLTICLSHYCLLCL